MINKTIDITVTSVHQTTAGKMIFGRYDERAEQQARQPAVPVGESNGGRAEPRRAENHFRHESSGRSEPHAAGEHSPRPVYPEPPGES